MTTAFDDQFAPEPVEPVRERYDTATILRRNIADLEIALRKQVERAEAAEAELLAVREDNHAMMLEIDGMRTELAKLREQEPVAYVKYKATGGNVGLSWLAVPTGAFYPRDGEKLYVSPIHAPAVPDCRACANRGQVNGLSQESYCDGCVYQGRSWRKNHFVLAVKRRCEACAILPCSCK